MSLADYLNKIKRWRESGDQIVLILLIGLSAGLGYGLGRLSEAKQTVAPLEISGVPVARLEKPAPLSANQISASQAGEASGITTKRYVASKNGTKYYLPSCSGANRIKEENKVWFASVEEARARGLEPASGCKGL